MVSPALPPNVSPVLLKDPVSKSSFKSCIVLVEATGTFIFMHKDVVR